MMKILKFLFLFLAVSFQVHAANLITSDDFETGPSWDYSDNWNDGAGYWADEWDIVSTDCYEGTYCAQSKDPNPGGIVESSMFGINIPNPGYGEQIFMRWYAKLPVDFQEKDNDKDYDPDLPEGANLMRLYNGGSTKNEWYDYRGGYDYQGTSYSTGWTNYKDNQWHEYAVLMTMPSSSTGNDGSMKFWKDDPGTYLDANATSIYNSANFGNSYLTLVRWGYYYKGVVDGNWLFHIDDAEVWDGIPSSTPDTTPPAVSSTNPANGATGILSNSQVTVNFNDTLDCSTVADTDFVFDVGTATVNSCSGSTVVLDVSGQSDDAEYTLTIGPNIDDDAANTMSSSHQISYTTGAPPSYGAFSWSAATYTVGEVDGVVNFTINRTGGSTGAVSVDWGTWGQTAQNGQDYTGVSYTQVDFADGETSKQVSLTILDDGDQETDETLKIQLDNPQGGAVLGSPFESIVTIQDDDSECADADGDGYSDTACGGADCDDTDIEINPGAPDICGDGIDQNCNGVDATCSGGRATKGTGKMKIGIGHLKR